MPLIDNAVLTAKEYGILFFIFYASRDENGEMWCPDCRRVEAFVKDMFEKTDVTGLVFYVGNRTQWKHKQNRYRRLFNVQRIPTVLQMTNTIETFRLQEDDILYPGHLQAIIDRSRPLRKPDPDMEPDTDSEDEQKPNLEGTHDSTSIKRELSATPEDSKEGILESQQKQPEKYED